MANMEPIWGLDSANQQPPEHATLYAIMGPDLLTVEALCHERDMLSISLQPYAVPVNTYFDAHSFVPQVVQVCRGRFELVAFAGACSCGQMLYRMPRCEQAGAAYLGDAADASLTGEDYQAAEYAQGLSTSYPNVCLSCCKPCRRKPGHLRRQWPALRALSERLHAREGAGF